MMLYRFTFIIMLGFGLSAQAIGQDNLSLSLEEAKAMALANSLALQDNALDVQIQEAVVKENLAQGLPQINGTFGYQYNVLNSFDGRTSNTGGDGPGGPVDQINGFSQLQSESIDEFVSGALGGLFSGLGSAFSGDHSAQANVSIRQQLFDGVYTLGLKAAGVYVDLTKKQALITERDIVKEVEKAYYGALIAQENIDIIDRNIQNIDNLKRETQAIYNEGFAEQLDVDRLALSLSNLQSGRASAVQIQDLSYAVLKNVLSLSLDTELQLTDTINAIEDALVNEEIAALVLNPERRVEFEVLDIQEELQELNIKRFESGKYPKVDAVASGGYDFLSNSLPFVKGFDNWYPAVNLGLQVSVPIFDGNRRKAQVEKATLERDKVSLSKQSLQQNIDIEIRNALITFNNAKTTLETQRANIQLAEKIYDTTKIKYKEGIGSSVEVNQAEQELFRTQQNYISALYDLLIARVDLDKAVGI